LQDEGEVSRWARSTLFLTFDKDSKGNIDNDYLCKKRADISLLPLPDQDGNAFQLHCYWACNHAQQDSVTSIGFILRASHVIIDGPGATTLLSDLRQELASPSRTAIDWTSSAFKEEQEKKLPRNAADLVAPEYRDVKPQDIESEIKLLTRMKVSLNDGGTEGSRVLTLLRCIAG